jgi:hypothetical protein
LRYEFNGLLHKDYYESMASIENNVQVIQNNLDYKDSKVKEKSEHEILYEALRCKT